MPRGDKSKYTDKQKRQAEKAEARAWATVNKIHHGGEKRGGSGYGQHDDPSVYQRAGHRGGKRAGMRGGR